MPPGAAGEARELRVKKLHRLTVFPHSFHPRATGQGGAAAGQSAVQRPHSCPEPCLPLFTEDALSARAWLPSAIPTVLHTTPTLGTYGDVFGYRVHI